MNTIHEVIVLAQINCGECGGTYAINEVYRAQKAVEGGSWHCPYCQIGWGYANSNENARLKRQIEEQKRLMEIETARLKAARTERDSAMLEAEHFRKSRDGMKGAFHKVAVRVKNGVCPCCKCTFSCLAEHMKAKHPNFQTNPEV
jgi:hypothetical protein